jgi:hypothetical protein
MRRIFATAGVLAALAGCANSPSAINEKEDFLAAAGFVVMPATAPSYADAVKVLPPHKFVHRITDGVSTYYYLDPTVCGCLYYGGDRAWLAYKQELADKLHMEAEQFLQKADTPYSGQGGI